MSVISAITAGSTVIEDVIDRVLGPDQKDKAAIIAAQVQGQIDLLKAQNAAALAEAQSSNGWTSAARPAFLYVMYILILFGVVMGFISVFSVDLAGRIATGLNSWLLAIPDTLWNVFETCFVVYAGGRTVEKATQHVTNAVVASNNKSN